MKIIGIILIIVGLTALTGPPVLGLAGGLFGLMVGLVAMVFGLAAGVVGAVVGIVGGLLGAAVALAVTFGVLVLPLLILAAVVVGLVKLAGLA